MWFRQESSQAKVLQKQLPSYNKAGPLPLSVLFAKEDVTDSVILTNRYLALTNNASSLRFSLF